MFSLLIVRTTRETFKVTVDANTALAAMEHKEKVIADIESNIIPIHDKEVSTKLEKLYNLNNDERRN